MLKRIRLGELLVNKNLISSRQLEIALEEQKKSDLKLGKVLIKLDFTTEDQILNAISEQVNIPFVQIENYRLKPEIVKVLPEIYARRYRTIVLDSVKGSYLIGIIDPTNILMIDELSRILKKPLRQVLVKESELIKVLDKVYRNTEEISSMAVELSEELDKGNVDTSSDEEAATATPVVKLLESIFKDAIHMNASDIHIEPDAKLLRIRQRIDGILNEHIMNEKRIASALVLRLKLMAKLNISEKRLPQDGRFNLKILGRSIDVRLSTMPIEYGESVVMRLLQRDTGALKLEETGMPASLIKRLRHHITRPHGMILVTGPTGSGKTTTLYGCLSELNKAETKIITVEDPVEYSLPRVNQVQINSKIDLTFANVLRAILRQDPDIIMVGEMRDAETAEIGLRASITGHLVLSTLHTNDAISSAMRLIDMGAESYLVATALKAILAQRLIRKLCPECKIAYTPTTQERTWLLSVSKHDYGNIQFYTAKGCDKCNGIGYNGRVGIYEFLELEGEMVDALRMNDPFKFTQYAKKSGGYVPLAFGALEHAALGVTSLNEVFRVAGDFD